MANTNTNRKRKKSKYSKNSENRKFNKKSFSIFFMFVSLLGFIFLILPNTGRVGELVQINANARTKLPKHTPPANNIAEPRK